MMTNHVPTIETCQRLKEAGFPQDNHWLAWYEDKENAEAYEPKVMARSAVMTYELEAGEQPSIELCAAPILTEILKQLPAATYGGVLGPEFRLTRNYGDYVMRRDQDECNFWEIHHTNPAEAAALLWLKLHKDNN